MPDEADDPQVALEKKDAGKLLQACLRELSLAHREIIDLVYYHEKSVDEVAEIVGVPRNTVKTRMHYARKRICELLHQARALVPDRAGDDDQPEHRGEDDAPTFPVGCEHRRDSPLVSQSLQRSQPVSPVRAERRWHATLRESRSP